MSYNKVQMGEISKVNVLIDSITVLILDKLKSKGKLLGFGQVNHYWGDGFIKRISERHPSALLKSASSFQAQKDNLYFIRYVK